MRVLVTGAAGSLGRVLTVGLADRGHDVAGLDLHPEPEGFDGPWFTIDCADPDAVSEVFAVARPAAVVHLAGHPDETNLPDSLHSHMVTTAASWTRCSSTTCAASSTPPPTTRSAGTPRSDLLTDEVPPRPDTFYGVAKVAAEALLSLYADRHGIDAISCRIGTCQPQPETARHLATWLSFDDWVRLVEACLTAPAPGYAVLYGISANTRAWWDLEPGRQLGYRPLDDAEDFASGIISRDEDAFEASYVGGPFVAQRFHRTALDRTVP